MLPETLPKLAPPPPRATPRSRLVEFTIALVSAGLCVVAGLMLYDARSSTYSRAVNNETNLLKVLSQDIARTIEDYDLSLQAAVDGLAEPGLSALDPHLQDLILYDMSASAKHLGAILVVDENGKVVRGSDHASVGADLGDREWFKAQKDHPDRGLFISAPFTHPVTGRDEVIAMSKSVRSRDGSFAGVVAGTLRLTYLKDLFAQADLGSQGVINLSRLDGTSLMRVSRDGARTGINIAGRDVFKRTIASPSGSFDAKAGIDGVDRIYTFTRVGDLPLVLTIALGRDDVYAAWRVKALIIILAVAALCAVATVQGVRHRHQTLQTARAERALAVSEAQYRLFADHAQDVIVRLDPALRHTYVSPAVRNMLGYEPGDLVDLTPKDLVHPDDWPTVATLLETSRRGRSNMEATYRLRHANGHHVWSEARFSFLRQHDGFVVVLRDVSERKAAEAELERANAELARVARCDALTGLSNRRHFDEVMDAEWRRARRSGSPISLLLLDIDRFKAFNDRYGHPEGDVCLGSVAVAVGGVAQRPGDLTARYGGEEFAVILPNTDEGGASLVAERVRAAIEALALPHEGNRDCGSVVTASVGCATARPGEGDNPARLVATADKQLYEAKRTGRNRVSEAMLACSLPAVAATDGQVDVLTRAHPRRGRLDTHLVQSAQRPDIRPARS